MEADDDGKKKNNKERLINDSALSDDEELGDDQQQENNLQENKQNNNKPHLVSYAAACSTNNEENKNRQQQGNVDDNEKKKEEKLLVEQYLKNCLNEVSNVTRYTNLFDDAERDKNDEEGEQKENDWFYGFLTKTITKDVTTFNSGRSTRSGNRSGNYTTQRTTNLASIFSGNGICFSVKITGQLTQETDPNTNPYHIFAIEKKNINVIDKTIEAYNIKMLNHGNFTEYLYDLHQLAKLPRLIGTISRDDKRNFVITPYELIEGNQYKGDTWKRIHQVKIPFGTSNSMIQVLAVGDEVEFMLIMGAEGPIATNITRGVIINPLT